MKQLYYSQVFPYLIGEISIWGSHEPNKGYLQPLIRTQKRLIRLMCNLPPRTHTNPLMKRHNIMNITNFYIHRSCLQMHPFIHPHTNLNRPQHNHHYLWTAQVHDYPTRHSLRGNHYIPNPNAHKHSKLKEPAITASHYTRTLSNLWNSIPADIRDTPHRATFKKKLKQYLMDKQNSEL